MKKEAFSWFRRLRPDNQQFAVIGLGRFGQAVCSTLYDLGYEVMGIDSKEEPVNHVLHGQMATHVLVLDSTDPIALKQAGVFELDTVIVSIGNYVEESVITTLNLKEGGVKFVVAKASSKIHEKLLNKVGADWVVFPEYEMGCNLAHSLTKPNVLERLELDPENTIVEVLVPEEFMGKTLLELKLRSEYGLTVIAINHQGNRLEVNPNPNQRMEKGDSIILVGENQAINRLPI